MAAHKKIAKTRSTKKLPSAAAAPKRAPAKAKTKVAKKKPAISVKPATRAPTKAKVKAKPKAKPATTPARTAVARRDATGHLNPAYAADLRARSRESADNHGNDNAFLRMPRAHDPLAEELGEEAVLTMTTGEDQSNRLQDMEVEEDRGGPFVTTSAREEFATGTDESNPSDAFREPFPTT